MKKLFFTLFISLFALCASAQQLSIGTGDPAATYSAMFKDMLKFCGKDAPLLEKNTGGSVDNMTQLTSNQLNGAFMQPDILVLRSRTDDLSDIKTLLALHTEQVHVIAKANSGLESGGTGVGKLKFGAQPVVFRTLDDLKGYKIGANGGSYVTAQVMKLQADLPYEVAEFGKSAETLAALDSGAIQAAVFVAGQGSPFLMNLGAQYKVLSISGDTAAKLKSVYKPAMVNYPKMNANGVPTVGMDAVMVTREYKTPKMRTALKNFRNCVQENIDTIKETTGTNQAWRRVQADARSAWPMYNLD